MSGRPERRVAKNAAHLMLRVPVSAQSPPDDRNRRDRIRAERSWLALRNGQRPKTRLCAGRLKGQLAAGSPQ
jgi:hypothetical protein